MTLVVEQLTQGPAATNCHLVRAGHGAAEAVVVDPAWDADEIRGRLAALGASCAGILLTHCHYDHFGGLAALAAATGAPVWLPEIDEPVFRDPDTYFGGYGIRVAPYTGAATLVSGGETVDVGGISFGVSFVPGHSPGHVAFHADGHLFSGDVLFAGSVGRTDLPGGDWDTLLDSIRRLAGSYPPGTIVHSGHGPDTTLGDELARNPFLGELRVP